MREEARSVVSGEVLRESAGAEVVSEGLANTGPVTGYEMTRDLRGPVGSERLSAGASGRIVSREASGIMDKK